MTRIAETDDAPARLWRGCAYGANNELDNHTKCMQPDQKPESVYGTLAEKAFADNIGDRVALWQSIIDESNVSAETKAAFTKSIEKFRDGAFTKWTSFDDAVYYTISVLLTRSKQDADNEEAKALFESLRDDLWAFWKETKE